MEWGPGKNLKVMQLRSYFMEGLPVFGWYNVGIGVNLYKYGCLIPSPPPDLLAYFHFSGSGYREFWLVCQLRLDLMML